MELKASYSTHFSSLKKMKFPRKMKFYNVIVECLNITTLLLEISSSLSSKFHLNVISFSLQISINIYKSNCVKIFRLIHINKESWRGQCFLIYQHFSSFAEPQSMHQEYKQGLQLLRLRLKIMVDISKILLPNLYSIHLL
jgi:hypothetical protein